MIEYLLKSGILLFIFFVVYKLWLENEKMFHFNRIYLIGSLVFSLIIPLQLFSFEVFLGTKLRAIQLEEIIISTSNGISNKADVYEIMTYVVRLIYIAVALLLTIRFVFNIYSFNRKLKNNEVQFINGEKIVLIDEPVLPHSFWNAIFINVNDYQNDKIPSELISHEKAHLDQKHTLDILFIEFLQIIFWFNPLVILYKKAIKLNHEFLADDVVNNQFGEVKKYQSLLFEIASNKTNIILASNINYLITKKRFLMMTKKESPARIVLKTCSIAIISSLLLFVFSCKDNAPESNLTVHQEDESIKNLASLEQKPEFPGGIEAFYKFVGKNYKTPEQNKLNGKIYITFVIEKDGSLSELKVLRDIGYGTGEEAIRVLKLSPKWSPGLINNKAVRTLYSLPITIQTED